MAEDIELRSIHKANESDSDEYHEIKEEIFHQATTAKKIMKAPDSYDFFTKYDATSIEKVSTKKKKLKKKKTAKVLDLVNSEMATLSVPLVESAITRVEYDENLIKCHIIEAHRDWRTLKRDSGDAEPGWAKRVGTVNLSPIFPRVLENAIVESNEIPVEYVEPTMYSELLSNINNTDKQAPKFLGIILKNLNFKHHHDFSLEKFLIVKLVELYEEYSENLRHLKETARGIKINRDTKTNLADDLYKVTSIRKEGVRFDPTVRKYTGAMLQLKDKQRDLIKKQKEVIHKIKSLWSDVEMVREKKNIVLTDYVLEIIEKESFDYDWTDLFKEEFSDALDRIEYEYINKYIEYKETKGKHKLDNAITKAITKPKLSIDEVVLKAEAERSINDLCAIEKIEIILSKNQNIVTNPNPLQTKSYHFFIEMYVDNVFVCQSERYSANSSLCVNFMETFSIQILSSNKELSMVLFENDDKVASLNFNIPGINNTNINADFVAVNFCYDTVVKPSSKYVGCGFSIKEIAAAHKVRLKSSNLFKNENPTKCQTDLKIGWNTELNDNQLENIKSSLDIGSKLKKLMQGIDKVNIETMQHIINKIYDTDITNDKKMIDTLRNVCKSDIKNDIMIQLDENSPEFVRIKLLHLRNNGGFINIENKMVPIHASQISTEQLNCLQKYGHNGFNMDYFTNKQAEMDPVELQRFVSFKYTERLNKNMLKNLNERLLKKTHRDIVTDIRDLSIRGIFSRVNLSSISNTTKQQFFKEAISKDQEIHVTVVRAFNLLDRSSDILETENGEEDTIAGYRVRSLRPFVRVTYHGASVQTVTGIGCHPSWNHTLKIKSKLEPLTSLHINIYDEYKANVSSAYSHEEHSNKTVHYRYYNKWLGTVEVPLHSVLTLGSLRGTFKISTPPIIFGYEPTQVKGTPSLISEINQLLKKETSFLILQITTSLSHLGGVHDYNQPITTLTEDEYLIKHLNNTVTEYLNDFPARVVTLTFIDSSGTNKCVNQFLQPIPPPNHEHFPKNPKVCESAVSKSSGLSKSSSSKSSGKRRDIDLEKGSVIEEKESIYSGREGSWRNPDNLTKMVNTCLRYVALIPSYDVTESHVVTLMGLELLKVLHGSPLDHTILLASYFLYLGIKCWVSIGIGLPRGRSSFVLIKYNRASQKIVQVNDLVMKKGLFNQTDGCVWYVCDAMSGEKHELRDVGSPMKTVEYVFDFENVWLNVQPSQDCDSISFDFSRSSDWQPVFDNSIFVMQHPSASEMGLYSAPRNTEDLRQTLEGRIKRKVQKWRPHTKTVWNRYCSGVLREMLPYWEYWAFNPSENKPILSQKLKQLMVTYKIFGFPMNMPFVSMKSVTSRVKCAGVHITDEPAVEFALGVEIFSYPNNVLSVWVFFATVSRI